MKNVQSITRLLKALDRAEGALLTLKTLKHVIRKKERKK